MTLASQVTSSVMATNCQIPVNNDYQTVTAVLHVLLGLMTIVVLVEFVILAIVSISNFITKDFRWIHNNDEEDILEEKLNLEERCIQEYLVETVRGNGESECSICLNTLNDVVVSRPKNCQHVFHKQCLNNWIQVNPTCPCCRQHLLQIPLSKTIHHEIHSGASLTPQIPLTAPLEEVLNFLFLIF